jgi:hypothetical protein
MRAEGVFIARRRIAGRLRQNPSSRSKVRRELPQSLDHGTVGFRKLLQSAKKNCGNRTRLNRLRLRGRSRLLLLRLSKYGARYARRMV